MEAGLDRARIDQSFCITEVVLKKLVLTFRSKRNIDFQNSVAAHNSLLSMAPVGRSAPNGVLISLLPTVTFMLFQNQESHVGNRKQLSNKIRKCFRWWRMHTQESLPSTVAHINNPTNAW